MSHHPAMLVPTGHVEPAPRRVRAVLAGRTVVDTRRAFYAWDGKPYPSYYLPLADVDRTLLVDEGTTATLRVGEATVHALVVGEHRRPSAAAVVAQTAHPELAGTVRLEWAALDAWYEEDEEVFVHPRNPYTRVDAMRSSRRVRVERDGVVLAETTAPVLVFESGLITRTYVPRLDVHLDRLTPSATRTSCPYKGTTSAYWSVPAADGTALDVAWSYDLPVAAMLPASGMVAFYDEEVDVFVDGEPQERPTTFAVGWEG